MLMFSLLITTVINKRYDNVYYHFLYVYHNLNTLISQTHFTMVLFITLITVSVQYGILRIPTFHDKKKWNTTPTNICVSFYYRFLFDCEEHLPAHHFHLHSILS